MSTNTIAFSSELMKNYKQAELMSPEKKFEALQTKDGHSLLFSIGTDNIFYVTEELPGHTTGWEKTDLSSHQISKDFQPGAGASCKTFEVAQNLVDGTIGVAMVLSDARNDHLYLCLGNSNADTGWIREPEWISFPYDDPDHPLATVAIVNVWISETIGGGQYIVVDTLRDPASAEKLVFRHYIDLKKAKGYAWQAHDVSIDLEAEQYSSCLGRRHGELIDGLYTFGYDAQSAQFIYQPLYNPFNPNIPPTPARLHLPGGLVPNAIAACRHDEASDPSTDLYVSAKGSLYYFASSNQKDMAEAVLLFANPILSGVRKLFAYNSGGKIIVWGLNASAEVFYMACPVDRVTDASSWSYPLPILTGVDLVSPYVNRVDNGNTFFAVAENQLTKAIQSAETTTWQSQKITLPALPTDKSQKFSSYTTRIQLTDASNQPVAKTALSISAKTRTAVYINHLYYVLGPTPIQVDTDTLGSLTIVEWVNSLQGTRLTVSGEDGTAVEINPMDKPFNKVAQLNTASSLKQAQITSSDGSTRSLVPAGVSDADLGTVANGNKNLATAYTNQNGTPRAALAMDMGLISFAVTDLSASDIVSDIGNDIKVAAGDLFNWLKSGVEAVIEIVEDAASGIWHFVATIAGQVYRAVLDGVETVVGAVEWMYNAIKTAIEDLIKYAEFLFEWQDISRTKAVTKNLVKLFLQDQVNEIEVIKEKLDHMIAEGVQSINNWAGITDWHGLGEAASAPANSKSNPTANLSSSTAFLSHHFTNNAGNINAIVAPATPNPGQSPIDTLFKALQTEGEVLSEVLSQLETLAGEYASLSLADFLKKLIAILADGVLESAQTVMDALLDILYEIATAALELLDTPIYIPVISDILSDFGVPSLSFLDLFCWIAAVPATIIYKLANDRAPFPDDANTNFLINASDWQSVVSAFHPAPQPRLAAASAGAPVEMLLAAELPIAESTVRSAEPPAAGLLSLSPALAETVFVVGHTLSGLSSFLLAVVAALEAEAETGDNPYAIPAAIAGIVAGVTDGMAVVLAPRHPIQNQPIAWLNRITTGIRVTAMVVFSGPAQSRFAASSGVMNKLKVSDGRATGAIVDAILVIPSFFCSCWHFSELSEIPASRNRSTAIIEETANLVSYISRVSYMVAVNDEDPESKQIPIGIMTVANVVYGGLQVAEAIVG